MSSYKPNSEEAIKLMVPRKIGVAVGLKGESRDG